MAMAARTTIVQAEEYVPAGSIDPEAVVTQALFVDRIVEVSSPLQESALVAEGASYP
jgi:3-oxoadipate CoA-transferase alpha subunit